MSKFKIDKNPQIHSVEQRMTIAKKALIVSLSLEFQFIHRFP